MFAEYEKAQILERYRRGKAHRAKTGSINVLGGAPFGYRYVRKTDHTGASYEIVAHEAALVNAIRAMAMPGRTARRPIIRARPDAARARSSSDNSHRHGSTTNNKTG